MGGFNDCSSIHPLLLKNKYRKRLIKKFKMIRDSNNTNSKNLFINRDNFLRSDRSLDIQHSLCACLFCNPSKFISLNTETTSGIEVEKRDPLKSLLGHFRNKKNIKNLKQLLLRDSNGIMIRYVYTHFNWLIRVFFI